MRVLSLFLSTPSRNVKDSCVSFYHHEQLLPVHGLAPNTYIIKSSSTAPTYSFGSRFDTDIRSKNHVKHEKLDKPAPGTYSPPDRQFEYPTTRFSKAERKSFAANPSYPGPDSYQP